MMEIKEMYNDISEYDLIELRNKLCKDVVDYHINQEKWKETIALDMIESMNKVIIKKRKETLCDHETMNGYSGEIL